jgi:DNA oxidative demethylase
VPAADAGDRGQEDEPDHVELLARGGEPAGHRKNDHADEIGPEDHLAGAHPGPRIPVRRDRGWAAGRSPSCLAGAGIAAMSEPTAPEGFAYHPRALDRAGQEALLAAVLGPVEKAGWYRPSMPRSGRPLSVLMCNLGRLGWVSDKAGYRYQPTHPDTGRPWPAIPAEVVALWGRMAPAAPALECCLVNLYRGPARLGLHRDEDEETFAAPVVSVSLGDAAWFRVGGLARRDPTRRLRLESGDVVVLGGAARLVFHGIDRIIEGSSTLVPGGGRINLTLRRVTPP